VDAFHVSVAVVPGAIDELGDAPGIFSSAPPPPQPERPRTANRTTNADDIALDTTTPRLLAMSPFLVIDYEEGRIKVLVDMG
jgi:hypothetical protein